VTTANEIHIPVGRPVRFEVVAGDVIHSFWIPELAGKTDLIPGQRNVMWLEADHPGVYRGQCAEYCGMQHSKMAMSVVADPPAAFGAWLARQRLPAASPSDPDMVAGEAVFTTSACALCHTIRGTPARGRVGPDLTHLASRRMIAAGTLPNTRGYLAGWIANPQALKPGNVMPAVPLRPTELQVLITYLQSLN
jgi:cytochrome c oxidase subunit 2